MNNNARRGQIVGTGLIGGSVALALGEAGWHVTGFDIDAQRAERAREILRESPIYYIIEL